MKTQEELQNELFNQTSEVEHVLLNLDKASLLLSHWMHEYTFREMPNPIVAAMAMTTIQPERNINTEQSQKWFYEYSQIIGFIDIVSDYVFESRKLLEKAIYGEKGNSVA